MAYTITEALQEIKTINKRLEVKRQSISQYVVRDARIKDPLEREGGSVEFVKRERQAIGDLEKRLIAIRTNIQGANLAHSLTVNGTTRTIAEWLTWRKEVAQGAKTFLTSLSTGIKGLRDKLQRETGRTLVASTAEGSASLGDAIVHLDEKELARELEQHEITLSELDGKLSLANATTTIEV